MASACMDKKGISKLLKHFHPNLLSYIESYNVGAYYIFPTYHGFGFRNRNGTRNKKKYNRGEVCINLFILLAGEKLKINIQTQKFIILDIEEMFIKEDFSYQVYY